MRQSLHILSKDIRHLWPTVGIFLLLTVVKAIYDIKSLPQSLPQSSYELGMSNLVGVVLTLSIAFLTAQLIFQENLVGQSQFWITRPYRWASLLTEKVLFILLFVTVPLIISDCFILGIQGFAVVSVVPEILLHQIHIAAWLLLPCFTFAAITGGIGQFIVSWFLLLLALILLPPVTFGGHVMINSADPLFSLALAALAVIAWQFVTRRTVIARVALATVVCLYFPATNLLYSYAYVHPRPAEPSLPKPAFPVSYDLATNIPIPADPHGDGNGDVMVRLPLAAGPLPSETVLRGTVQLKYSVDGKAWPKPNFIGVGSVDFIAGSYWQTAYLPKSSLDALEHHGIDVDAAFKLELVSDKVEFAVPSNTRRFVVPNLAACRIIESTAENYLTCRSGLNQGVETDVRLDVAPRPERALLTLLPQSVPWGLSPTTEIGSATFQVPPPGSHLLFAPRHKLADYGLNLKLTNLNINKYKPAGHNSPPAN